jgi:hypothetical protein
VRPSRPLVIAAAGLCAAAALAGCGGGGSSAPATPAAAAPAGAVDLKAAGCPDTVVIQTDWNPESEHGGLYQMFGPDPTVDAGTKRVSGPLLDKTGAPTGVNLEVRTGGPAIGFQQVSAQMYTDPAITLGYVNTDEAAQLSTNQPTTAVFAPLDKSPLMIMWDPATYPQVKTIADLGKTGARVRYFESSAYMAYFTGSGQLTPQQVDGSYDGTPANFVAAGGKDAQQGFASAEPYIYQNEVPAWGKPVAFQLLHDAGFQAYQAAISVRTGDLDKLSGCLTKLVPVLQQAQVDYMADPAKTNALMIDLVQQYDTGWVYSEGVAKYSAEEQIKLGLVGNGPNATIGDFDMPRIQGVLDIVKPIFAGQGTPVKDGTTPETLATNQFIDPSIGLPAGG